MWFLDFVNNLHIGFFNSKNQRISGSNFFWNFFQKGTNLGFGFSDKFQNQKKLLFQDFEKIFITVCQGYIYPTVPCWFFLEKREPTHIAKNWQARVASLIHSLIF